ncbi:predicted protein [Chaetomium globosum CBS 148.51]|uniref:Cellobiose dehydrogenase-like cytochrome domain-containing protein n=1 Tax=Chaetomium globosum (strain ATCC 6205 / CBS 148.51 / DSM 1962 / NBRC 6347 / NRRL 1970) TaxID=306901 RepID=Q2GTS9_CHAGB|nr:uncharacterized protein CHGG_08625 [Chaetomium globosum CBS 148.51]EAQ84611.1 predicted protein [Chaetomium globosum CBS 148.51]
MFPKRHHLCRKMQYLTPLSTLGALFLAGTATISARGEQAGKYTDVVTNIRFRGNIEPSSFTFGLMTPQEPTTDFVAQIVAPLVDGAGWGGVSLGNFMTGPLLVVTLADGDKVMTAGRVPTNTA